MPASVVSAQATADQYAAAHDRVVHLVRHLDAEDAARPVPATPLWNVHDVLAHLAAVPGDLAAGRMTGIPRPHQTQEQVDARREVSVADLLAEWAKGLPAVLEDARAGRVPPPLAIDAITHEQDLRAALHVGRLENDAALRFGTTGYALGLARRLAKAELAPLRLRDPARGFDMVAGDGEPAASVTGPEFELFRAMAGRRSRKQVAALEWTGEAEPYLDAICVFGPLPDGDVND